MGQSANSNSYKLSNPADYPLSQQESKQLLLNATYQVEELLTPNPEPNGQGIPSVFNPQD